ncbi:MAG TPA: MFS transporter [Candidatus Acidoferrales bacterium]|nr:MFS transporter [Candidatus Acidoferrales bacterium]
MSSITGNLGVENVVPARASSIRWRVMACITLVTTLTYLDRLNLSIAAKFIQDEFRFTTQQMGWVLSAFLLGYALLQIPGGWIGDRFGARNVLAGAIVFWSAFTACTGLAPRLMVFGLSGVWSFMIARFLVGAGEAATSPNGNKIVANWMGSAHRGTGASFTILGVGIGGAITPPFIAMLMQRYGWRASFYISAILGLAVVAVWLAVVTNRPEENRRVNAAELSLIAAGRASQGSTHQSAVTVPWSRILRSASAWGLFLGYFCQGFPIYFYHTWFFLYLIKVRHLGITEGGWWGATPYLAIVALAPLGGIFSDWISTRLGKRAGRRIAVASGMFASSALLWFGSHAAKDSAAIAMLAIGGGMNMFAASTFWAACIDLTTGFTGALSGMMNTFGNLGGWLSPIVTAYLAQNYGWNRALDCAAVVSVLSGLFFQFVQADRTFDSSASAERVG